MCVGVFTSKPTNIERQNIRASLLAVPSFIALESGRATTPLWPLDGCTALYTESLHAILDAPLAEPGISPPPLRVVVAGGKASQTPSRALGNNKSTPYARAQSTVISFAPPAIDRINPAHANSAHACEHTHTHNSAVMCACVIVRWVRFGDGEDVRGTARIQLRRATLHTSLMREV